MKRRLLHLASTLPVRVQSTQIEDVQGRVFFFQIVIVVGGRYLAFRYLDPQGLLQHSHE